MEEPTRSALVAAGWFPGRFVDMSATAQQFEQWGATMHPLARSILEQLGGLLVGPFVEEGVNYSVEPFVFDPVKTAEMNIVDELNECFGGPFFPVALMYVNGIYVSASGLTVCSLQYENWELGWSFGEALERLVCAEGEIRRFDRP
ncbi:SUKH-3 domain-containing protein [Streptomyces sp. NPDC058691]|uniref:SUKH-3 domain-containing protein n=1 Tax=Streptomyces sp. NPDC058691 TaxID=3346601 RepID=UPI003663E239